MDETRDITEETIEWVCPECGAENFSVRRYTPGHVHDDPWCEECEHEPTWEEILAQPRPAMLEDVLWLFADLYQKLQKQEAPDG